LWTSRIAERGIFFGSIISKLWSFDKDLNISTNYNVIKKGTSFHIVQAYNWNWWNFIESMGPIESVIFSISSWEVSEIYKLHNIWIVLPGEVCKFLELQNI